LRRTSLLLAVAVVCAACGESSASRDVAAVRDNPVVRRHLDTSVFPTSPGSRRCSIHLGGGISSLGKPGQRLPATCSTRVQEHAVTFSVRWRGFHERGVSTCDDRGASGLCLESPGIRVGTSGRDRYSWQFRLDSSRHITWTHVRGAFPPWWVIPVARHATLRTFAGLWTGHVRQVRINRKGLAAEVIYANCCDRVIDLRFRLSRPRGSGFAAAATARLTAVRIHAPSLFTGRAPRVGETGTFRLKNGVVTEPFTGATFCTERVNYGGRCGA